MNPDPPATTTTELVGWAVLTALAIGGFGWALLRGQFENLDRAARLPFEEEGGNGECPRGSNCGR
ncbi:MAG TPA: cbb3-type cytochrome oxidase assembly protein [Verrucomicrobiota bacterium]|nr:cbb3-type cytochrome oxidase assembly protein [Verrucomicrobiota bacterium]